MKKITSLLLALLLVLSLAACTVQPRQEDYQSVNVRLGGLKGPTSMGMAKLLDDAVTNARRSAFELRATWMAEFYLEAKKDGIDLEPIMRRAIRRVGSRNGQAELDAQGGDLCVSCFGKNFMKVPGTTFEMQPTRDENGAFDVDFHYCPLLTAWQKLGLDQETCALLCDIAMEGDRGMSETLGLDFQLPQRISMGDDVCTLCFKKK